MNILVLFILLSGLYGCAHEEIRAYSNCIVTDVEEKTVGDVVYSWLVHCDDGSVAVFSRMIQMGDVVTYSPYMENSDPVPHGYIKQINQAVP